MRKLRIAKSHNTTITFKGEVSANNMAVVIDFFKKDCHILGFNNRVYVQGNSSLPLQEIQEQLFPVLGTQATIQK